LILVLNKFFRRPKVEGRESSEAYWDWEYRWGRDLNRTYLEPAGDLQGKTVLDIGCGLGGKTLSFGDSGASAVFGTDISVENAAAGHDYASRSDFPFKWAFFTADAARLPLADGTIDTVVANDTMEHFADPEGALLEMERVTKPGGTVWIFFTPYYSPLGSHLYDYIYIPWCHLLFSRRRLEGAVRRILDSRHPEGTGGRNGDRADEIMNSFDRDLNRMSIRRFLKMTKKIPTMTITFRQFKPAKFRVLKILTGLPLVRELFTGSLICRLEKPR
jgi:SAM-dependent methyltransferase